ncbi:MAG TPA: hypothetical protein VNN19_12230 [bacterium]|jgi:hypothetical protein|nr:hypothetical protein [bacterium]
MTRWLLVGAALLAAAGCRKRELVRVDTTEAKDIPREIAVDKLREVLPTAEQVICTLPSERLRPSEIKEWTISSASVQMRVSRGEPFVLPYGDITELRLEKVSDGRYWVVKVFTSIQTNPGKEHYQFVWKNEESARRALELFEALRQKM